MYILQVGFNHQTTPVSIREQFSFDDLRIRKAHLTLKHKKSILENVIISTCNRTEIYAVVDQLHTGRYYIKQFLQDWFDVPMDEFADYLIMRENEQAVEHLFQVATGLQSLVLGETQILGQVRDAFFIAQEQKTTGTIFNELFNRVISFAKRSHRETAIGEHAVSVSYAAVQLARKTYGAIEDKHAVIYGAGEMGELAIRNLLGAGLRQITIVNRTLSRAKKLANQFNLRAVSSEQLSDVLLKADVLISSTGASRPVLTKADIEPLQKYRRGKPLFIVDIAVPRDVESAIGEMESVFLYDIDDLQHIVDENKAEREKAAMTIAQQLPSEIESFNDWIMTLGVVPIIRALRENALEIHAETFASLQRKIPTLTEREQKVISKHMKSIINQMLREPIIQAKEMAAHDDKEEKLIILADIFGIDETIKHDVKRVTKQTNNILQSHSQYPTSLAD